MPSVKCWPLPYHSTCSWMLMIWIIDEKNHGHLQAVSASPSPSPQACYCCWLCWQDASHKLIQAGNKYSYVTSSEETPSLSSEVESGRFTYLYWRYINLIGCRSSGNFISACGIKVPCLREHVFTCNTFLPNRKKRKREMVLDKATKLLGWKRNSSSKQLPWSFLLLLKASATSRFWDLVAAFHRFPINLPILPLDPFFLVLFSLRKTYAGPEGGSGTFSGRWIRASDEEKAGSVKPNISQLEGCWPQWPQQISPEEAACTCEHRAH